MDETGPDVTLTADFRRELTGCGTYKSLLTWADLEAQAPHLPGVRALRDKIQQVFYPQYLRPVLGRTLTHTGAPSAPGTKKYLVTVTGRPDLAVTLTDHGGGRWTSHWLVGAPADIPAPDDRPDERFVDV